MIIQDIINKRKQLWNDYVEGRKPNQDEQFVLAAAKKILSDDNLRKEIQAKPYLLIECVFTVVDKNKKTGVSELYSLADFSPRKDENIYKSYILGKYGAIPHIMEE